MADNTFKNQIFKDYTNKGFKGNQVEFDSLLNKPEFLSQVHNDYTKLGFKGNLTDFSNLLSKPTEEKGFLEKARETLGEVLFGAGSTKKAPEKPAVLQFGEEDNLREIFLKNAAKQTFGSTPEELNDDISFAINSPRMFHAVSNLADTHQKQFESIVKDKTKSWDVQSKELTQMNESFSKPYLDDKNKINSELEKVNTKLQELEDISSNIQANQKDKKEDYTYKTYVYPKGELFEEPVLLKYTLSDIGNQKSELLQKKESLEQQFTQNEENQKTLQRVITSPSSYLNSVAKAARDTPDALLNLKEEDFGYQLAKTQAEITSMDNAEKKNGRLYPYNVDINGKPIKDLLSEKFSLGNSNLFNWSDKLQAVVGFYEDSHSDEERLIENKLGRSVGTSVGGIVRQIQDDAYNGANNLESNIEANKKSYSKAIADLQKMKVDEIAKAKAEGKIVSPEWDKQVDAKISDYLFTI